VAEDGTRRERAERFGVNRSVAVGAVVFASVCGLIGLSMMTVHTSPVGGRIFGAVMVVFAVWFGFRGVTGGRVTVSATSVTTRSFLRTHRYQPGKLAGARVGIGQTGPSGFGRQYLVLTLTDGSEVAFRELNCRPAPNGEVATVVERAVSAIGQALGS
jgi:hypothetical protein